jgi:hypothetical protein
LAITVCEAAVIGTATSIVIAATVKNVRPELSRHVMHANIIETIFFFL